MGKVIIPKDHLDWLAGLYIRTDVTLRELGDQYGVTGEAIRLAVHKAVPDAHEQKRQRAEQRQDRKDRELAEALWKAVDSGIEWMSQAAELAETTRSKVGSLMTRRPDLMAGYRQRLAANRRNRTEKTCCDCSETKPVHQFHKGDGADGRSARCASCAKAAARAWWNSQDPHAPVVQEKDCPACRRTLPAERFAFNRKATSGLQTYCRECGSRLGAGESVREILESWGHEYRQTRQSFEVSA